VPPLAATVNLFDYQPRLLAKVDPEFSDALRARGRVSTLAFQPGIVEFDGVPDGALGLVVLEGVLTREVTIVGRTSVEPLGPGDLLRPWDDDRAEAPIPVTSVHRALDEVVLAVLGPRFGGGIEGQPHLVEWLCARLTQRARWLAMQSAIGQLTRIEDRVLVLLWHLADRWGRVERDGSIVIPIRLTHKLLAGMVAAQRPTVTTALSRLTHAGHVTRHEEGWALRGQPPTAGLLEGQALADAFRLRDD
jgi:CRP/FNR family cyclic AMP-dependent transcriptional regulator